MAASGGFTLGRHALAGEHRRGGPWRAGRSHLSSPLCAALSAVLVGAALALTLAWLRRASTQPTPTILSKADPGGAARDAPLPQRLLGAGKAQGGAPPATAGGGGGEAGSTEPPRARPQLPPDHRPRVFFDIAIGGAHAGRVTFELFTTQSPMAAENFRALCTGEKGRVPDEAGREGAGQPLHFKGREFYRVIDRFICQSGAPTESIYGGQFRDDPGGLQLRHDRKGLLSMANMGHDTNTAHFSIMMAPAPHLDGHYTIFGEVVSGFDVVEKMNKLAKAPGLAGGDERPRLPIVIADCGQL